MGKCIGELTLSDDLINDRIALATTDAAVAVLNAAIEAFYEADFCPNCYGNAHQLRVFAVRTERATELIGRRRKHYRFDPSDTRRLAETVLV